MAIVHFDPKTARGSVSCGRSLRARFRDMGEVCTLLIFVLQVFKAFGNDTCLLESDDMPPATSSKLPEIQQRIGS